MFRIINFISILRYLAIGTAVISIIAFQLLQSFSSRTLPLTTVGGIASWIALFFIFSLTTGWIVRPLWSSARFFNGALFPDLNGTWEGEITTADNKIIHARAVIRQTLLLVQIDIHTETSKSLTLETTPATESGQHKIYYLYRSIPKRPDWAEYKGSTIFDIRSVTEGTEQKLELSGTYFTSRQTVGRTRLRQVSPDTTRDVSFY